MKAELLAFCRQEDLIQPGDTVICAVSGGGDSIALLHCLHSLEQELDIQVQAAHFNHRLRGQSSDEEESFVRSFCAERNIPLHVAGGDVAAYAKEHHLGIEEAARLCRYGFFEGLGHKIATAHHADDNLETVLLHLLRGSGLRGLCGIPPKRGSFIRPLLGLSREQIQCYLKSQGLPWCEDRSNADLQFTRNRLRHRVLPLLQQENPRLAATIGKQSRLLRQEDALLDSMAGELLQQDPSGNYLIAPVRQAPDPLQKRALRILLRNWLSKDVALPHIEALQSLLSGDKPSAAIKLPNGLVARRCYDSLQILRPTTFTFPEIPLSVPGVTELPSLGLRISCEIQKKFIKIPNSPFLFAVKYDMISQYDISLRQRQVGDRFLTPGGHRTSLKKLLIDRKIPRWERDRLPVFTDGHTIIAVAGLGARPDLIPARGQTALIIRIEKEEMPHD